MSDHLMLALVSTRTFPLQKVEIAYHSRELIFFYKPLDRRPPTDVTSCLRKNPKLCCFLIDVLYS